MVAECGGLLTHSMVVVVVNQLIKTGDRVRVEGITGLIVV